MEKIKPRIYGVIWDTLSVESQEKVEQTDAFATTVANVFNVVLLVTRIHATHHSGVTGIAAIDKKAARDTYGRIRMQSHESISEYHKRFVRACKAIEDTGGPESQTA